MNAKRFLGLVLQFDKKFSALIKAICIILLVAIIVIITVSVFTRFVMFNPLNFTDSLATYLMIWLSFLGMGLAFRESEHISVDMLINKLNEKNKRIILIVSDILVSAFLIVVIFNGFIFAVNGSNSYDHILFGMSLTIPYLSVSVGALYALIQLNIVTLINVLEVD